MKVLAILLLCLLAITHASQEITSTNILGIENVGGDDNDVKAAIEIIGGIFVGAFKSSTSIKECFDDTQSIFSDFSNAYISLRQETVGGITDGLVHIGKALLKVPDAVRDCKDLGEIVVKIRSLAVKFSNPTLLTVSVGKNILWHGISIFREVNLAITEYQNQEWFSFGMSIGSIMDMVFLSNPHAEPLQSTGSEFLKGFANGVSPSAYNDVEACLNNVSQETIDRIKKDVESISVKHVKESISAIEDIGKTFVSAIKQCKSSKKSVLDLIEKLSAAFTGKVFIDAAWKIAKNPLHFVSVVESIHSNWKHHHYFASGQEIGKFVGEVLKTRMEISSVIQTLL
jgi:hypothetical protein